MVSTFGVNQLDVSMSTVVASPQVASPPPQMAVPISEGDSARILTSDALTATGGLSTPMTEDIASPDGRISREAHEPGHENKHSHTDKDEGVGKQEPFYKAIANELRQSILAGEFAPQKQLPTEAELASARGVSRQTVRQAYAELVAENLVYRVRGRGSFATGVTRDEGTYVRSFRSVNDLLALSVDTELEVLEPLTRRTDVDAAGRLQLASDAVMVSMFRRLHEGVAFCVTTVYLPADIGRRLGSVEALSAPHNRTRETIIGLIEREAEISIAGAHQSITAAVATPELASFLDVSAGDPMLRIDRVYFNHAGENVELAVSFFDPSRYSYRLELRREGG
jgi:GntR family transcriptional regulator